MSDENARASGVVVKKADAVEGKPVDAGVGTRVQVLLGEADGAPGFAMRRFRMEADGGMPRHTNAVEHEQYVLSGKARVVLGEETHVVASGDVLFIPAGLPHSYEVLEAPFEFLCMVPNREDTMEILE